MLFGTEEAPSLAVVVEVQRSIDERKKLTWPHYETSARARHRCDACVLVFATTDEVATWAEEPVRLGPLNTFRAIVIDARSVPTITADEARKLPTLSVLSAITHARDAAGVSSAQTAIDAIGTLHPNTAPLYLDAILQALDEAARRELETSMNLIKNYKYQSDFAKKYFSEGGIETARKAILEVLTVRGLAISDQVRARIDACDELTVLQGMDRPRCGSHFSRRPQ